MNERYHFIKHAYYVVKTIFLFFSNTNKNTVGEGTDEEQDRIQTKEEVGIDEHAR